MNLVYYLALSVVIGWIATDLMGLRANLVFNVMLSALGALLAGFFVAPRLGYPMITASFNYRTLLVSLGGALILLLIFNFPKLFNRGYKG